MEEDIKIKLRNKIERIAKILIVAKESFLYSSYLHYPETKEESDYLNNSSHFKFIRHSLWRQSIIELSKLFSGPKSRDRFNINNFLVQLKVTTQVAGLAMI